VRVSVRAETASFGKHTTGTFHDTPAKTADEMSMMMKTTHSVFLPESPTNWYSGESGMTVGMGATPVGVAVGRGRSEVFMTASNWSTIMAAVCVAEG
jgi:hypothetical protein